MPETIENEQMPQDAGAMWRELAHKKRLLRERINQGQYGKGGQFTTTVLEDARSLGGLIDRTKAMLPPQDSDWSLQRNNQAQADYLSACCWAAEGLEYFGRTEEVRAVIEPEGRRLLALLDHDGINLSGDRLAIQQCHLLLHYSHCCLYRKHQYEQALSLIARCDDEIVEKRRRKELPCYRTRIRIASMRGAAQRQLGELFEARRSYQLAITLIHNRMEAEQARTAVSAEEAVGRLSEVEIRSLYELGKCFLHGFCATRYISGLLVQAQADVSAALVMLRRNGDVMSRAYAQLLEATITRCSAGSNTEKLTEALAMVNLPRAVFAEHGHARYLSRCDYESALGYLYLGRAEQEGGNSPAADRALKEARLAITRVAEYAEVTADADWRCIAFTLLSRIARSHGVFEESRAAADQALLAARGGSGKVKLDAHVAKGASLLDDLISAKDIEEAIEHFEAALKLASNPKATGNCYLHLADANLRRNELAQAKEQFRRWLSVRKEVQHASVHAFADRVEAQLSRRDKDVFSISPGDSLDYDFQLKRLRRFLIDQATIVTSSPEEGAELLGVTRQTVYNWKTKLAGTNG